MFAGLLALLPVVAAVTTRLQDRSFERVDENGIPRTVFEHAATGAKLDFVTNSGICETTAGVNQYSGYLSAGTNMNMWFWFFESRSSPSSDPLVLWLNGGPGCSSMIGLFQENGPCQFYNGASTPSTNPYSFNSVANTLYVDQPIGTGFSYGTDSATGTISAASYVWTFLQAFYAKFPDYESREFALFTESYGGHYGPEFAFYFESQNAKIAAGTLTGEKINLIALGINNGWFDGTLQYPAYADYAASNPYKTIISASKNASYHKTFTSSCLPLLKECPLTGSNSACESADSECYNVIEGPITEAADFDVYDVREPSADSFPPETYVTYLGKAAVKTAIGATSTYSECPDAPYEKFSATGDDARSFLSTLSTVVQSGIQVLLWAGDADFICNYKGVEAVANAVTFTQQTTFRAAALKSYTVNGTAYGVYKTAGNFSYLRVSGAGHEVPYYQPIVALQAFTQTISKTALKPT